MKQFMQATYVAIFTLAVLLQAVAALAADKAAHYFGSNCSSPLTLDDVAPMLDKGLCKSGASFLGGPVCNDWHAFLAGTAPTFPLNGYTVGGTFRVELAKNGSLAWSEHNPLYVIYNRERTGSPVSIGIIDVSPDNAEEEAEAMRYLKSTFSGLKPSTGSLDQYIKEVAGKATEIHLQSDKSGAKGSLPGCGEIYLRKRGDRQYALIITKHSNAWEPDSHPVIYFTIFPASK